MYSIGRHFIKMRVPITTHYNIKCT